jgi:hypothetical protein
MSRQMCKIAGAVRDVDLNRLRIVCKENTGTIVPEPAWARHSWPRAESVIALHATNSHALVRNALQK